MGDMGDIFKALKQDRSERKQERLKEAITKLDAQKIPYVVLSYGNHHYRIDGNIDYWPTTGKWITNNGKIKGYGINKLLRFYHERLKQLNIEKENKEERNENIKTTVET